VSVAVIIVNYESDGLLRQCLDKLMVQSHMPDDVVVVDNHNKDHDLTELKEQFPIVRVISAGSNIGFAAAANLGFHEVPDAEFVAHLNPDAFPEADWLAELLRAARENPQCGSYSSLMMLAGQPGLLDGGGDTLHFSGVPWRVGHGRPEREFSVEQAGLFSACAGAALYRAEALREAGGFDESYFMYIEDVDLGFRLQLLGYPCCFVPEAVVQHLGSAIAGYKSDFSLYYGHRNLVWSYFKNMPWQLLVLTLPFHILMNLVTLIVFIGRGKGSVILRSKRDALRGLPAVFRRRAASKLHRQISITDLWKLLDKSLVVS